MKLIKKSNGYWYAKIVGNDGRLKEFSTRSKCKITANKMVKEAKLEELELAARAQVLTAEAITKIVGGKKVNLTQALERWAERMRLKGRSTKTEHNSLTAVGKWIRDMKLGNRPPSFVDIKHVSKWVNNPAWSIKASTRGTYLSSIRSFIQFCADEGWRVGNPAEGVVVSMDNLSHAQKERREVKLFTEANVAAIVAATDDPFWRFATSLSFTTGLRLGDICSLELDCFDGADITVWTDKRDKRVGPFTMDERTIKLLMAVPISSSVYIFPKHKAIYSTKTRRARLSSEFREICDSVGLYEHTFHGLRHTYATNAYRSEENSVLVRLQKELAGQKVSKDMGHSNLSTTKEYIH